MIAGKTVTIRWPMSRAQRSDAAARQAGGESIAAAAGQALTNQMQWSIPLFGGGGVSTVALAVSLAAGTGKPLLIAWSVSEVFLATARLVLTLLDRLGSHAWAGRRRHAATWLEVVAAVSVGLGSAVAVSSGSVVGVVLGWMTGTAFAGENCARNIGSLRLTQATVAIGVTPLVAALAMSGQPVLQAVAVLTTLFAIRMMYVVRSLNTVLQATMRAERESDHRARHDKLTGLLNRGGLERELELMRRDHPGANLTLFFIDLDRFKRINDTHGHAAGDIVLRRVAESLLGLVGSRDIAARIGGDEFVVVSVLGHIAPAEFGTAIHRAIAGNGSHSPTETITASVGAAQTSIYGDDLNALMSAADVRLYRAKHAGGNICVTD